MGAGKTTVARALGRRIGWRVEDIDHRIEARERRSVSVIFAREGEPYFRQAERAGDGGLAGAHESYKIELVRLHARSDSSTEKNSG